MLDNNNQILTHKILVPFHMAVSGHQWIGSDIDDGIDIVVAETWAVYHQESGQSRTISSFTNNVANFQEFLVTTGADGTHMKNHVNCGGCKKAKATLRSVGGDNMKSLFDHVGWVIDTDTIKEALSKVADSIQQQVRLQMFQ